MERGSKSGFAQGCMCDCAMSAWAVSSHPFPSSMTRRWGSTHSWVGMDHHALGSTDTHNLSGCDPRSQHGADLPSTISGALGTAAWSSPSFSLYLPSRDQHSLPFRSCFCRQGGLHPDLTGLRLDVAIAPYGTRELQGRMRLPNSEGEGRVESSSSWSSPAKCQALTHMLSHSVPATAPRGRHRLSPFH